MAHNMITILSDEKGIGYEMAYRWSSELSKRANANVKSNTGYRHGLSKKLGDGSKPKAYYQTHL